MAAVLEEVRPAGDQGQAVAGRSPWALAARQLWRNRLAMASLALFLLIVLACFLAPTLVAGVWIDRLQDRGRRQGVEN